MLVHLSPKPSPLPELAGSEAYRGTAVGDVYEAHDGKRYKFVQYDAGAGSVAAVAGNMAYYYAPSGASAGATTVVTSDLSDSANVGAGMLMSAPADGEYCWIQTHGPATLNTALSAGADGNALTPLVQRMERWTFLRRSLITLRQSPSMQRPRSCS
ncbi:MAG: hypothetical protein R3D70_09360 [Rhizobiaceae bacterium]